MNDSGLESGPRTLDSSISEFVQENESYYLKQFSKIQGTNGFAFSWNSMAALFGPLWGAFRGAWGFFWTFLVLELFALVQIGRGLWGDLGADQIARYEKMLANIAKREDQAKELIAAGNTVDAEAKLKIASNLKRVAAEAKEKARKEREETKSRSRSTSSRRSSSRSRRSSKSALEKVLTSPTVIRSVLGIISKMIK